MWHFIPFDEGNTSSCSWGIFSYDNLLRVEPLCELSKPPTGTQCATSSATEDFLLVICCLAASVGCVYIYCIGCLWIYSLFQFCVEGICPNVLSIKITMEQ